MKGEFYEEEKGDFVCHARKDQELDRKAEHAERALAALGHVKVPNDRCTARYKDTPALTGCPKGIPIWCALPAGHEGPHLHVHGHHSSVMGREHLIEFKPLPDVCQKCGSKWPCKDAITVYAAFADAGPCGCYPNHCTDTHHGECWCEPKREGDLIIHNDAS